jgi:hypothetical protein
MKQKEKKVDLKLVQKNQRNEPLPAKGKSSSSIH